MIPFYQSFISCCRIAVFIAPIDYDGLSFHVCNEVGGYSSAKVVAALAENKLFGLKQVISAYLMKLGLDF